MDTSKFTSMPKKQGLKKAQIILDKSSCSAIHLFVVYQLLNKITSSKRAKKGGAPTEEQQDLLRSAILFSCAGLDAVLKQLVEDNLDYLVEHQENTRASFEDFVEKKIRKGNGYSSINYEFIAKTITNDKPRKYLVAEWKKDLKSNSLQSIDEVKKICHFLSIEEKQIIKNKEEEKIYRDIFVERNRITHEMDINFCEGKRRNRRSRKLKDTEKQCENIVDLGYKIINLLEEKIQ